MYQCEVTTPEGFVQQLAVSYLGNGYWFYVTGDIPEGKDPRKVDAKLPPEKQGTALMLSCIRPFLWGKLLFP